jgi:hypothetical protein
VGQDHEIDALGELPVALDRLAAELVRELRRTTRAGVRAQHGIAPPAGERPGHVSCADESDLHGAGRYLRTG